VTDVSYQNDYLSLAEFQAMSALIGETQANPSLVSTTILEQCLDLSDMWIGNYGSLDTSGSKFSRDMKMVALLMSECFWIKRLPENVALSFLPTVREALADYSIELSKSSMTSAIESFCKRVLARHSSKEARRPGGCSATHVFTEPAAEAADELTMRKLVASMPDEFVSAFENSESPTAPATGADFITKQ
jgi:hypothetical protein